MEAPIYDEVVKEESLTKRWVHKAINNPFLTGGVLGLGGVLFLGARSYKNLRATGMSTSVFLMQLRVTAQGMVAGALMLGLIARVVKGSPSNENE